jgi:hypothetical protein
MKFAEAPALFERLLVEAGLPDGGLAPWSTWKVFKAFARVPLEEGRVVDDLTVQYGPEDDEGIPHVALYFSREFSEPTEEGAEPVAHVGCEFRFPVEALGSAIEGEYWTQDFPTLEEFLVQVEGAEGFQMLMSARPISSTLYRQEA